MPRVSFAFLVLFLACATVAQGVTTCDRPHFKGEVWAGTMDSAVGETIVYWVFDDGFYEYLYFTNSGVTKLIATAKYTRQNDASYTIEIPSADSSSSKTASGVPPRTLHLSFSEGVTLALPSGGEMTRVIDPQQWIPPVQRIQTERNWQSVHVLSTNDTCCCWCWRTHAFLGISFADPICCFFVGGCSDASGFCGSGGGSVF